MLQEPHAQAMAQAMQSYIDHALGDVPATPLRGVGAAPGAEVAETGRNDRSALAA
jgi:hypothetical protein